MSSDPFDPLSRFRLNNQVAVIMIVDGGCTAR